MKFKEALEYILDFVPEDEKRNKALQAMEDEFDRIAREKRALLELTGYANELDINDKFNCGFVAAVYLYLQMINEVRNE